MGRVCVRVRPRDAARVSCSIKHRDCSGSKHPTKFTAVWARSLARSIRFGLQPASITACWTGDLRTAKWFTKRPCEALVIRACRELPSAIVHMPAAASKVCMAACSDQERSQRVGDVGAIGPDRKVRLTQLFVCSALPQREDSVLATVCAPPPPVLARVHQCRPRYHKSHGTEVKSN